MGNTRNIVGVGGKLLGALKASYVGSKACVKYGERVSNYFDVGVGVHQGCVMSPWLFNVYMDGVIKEVKARIAGAGVKMYKGEDMWKLWTCLYADDAVLVAESARYLQRIESLERSAQEGN